MIERKPGLQNRYRRREENDALCNSRTVDGRGREKIGKEMRDVGRRATHREDVTNASAKEGSEETKRSRISSSRGCRAVECRDFATRLD